MMARGTIDAAAIATTTVGKEEARSNPGFFFAWLNKQVDNNQHNQSCDADIHHAIYAAVLRRMPFGKFAGHKVGEWILHGALSVKGVQILICESWSRVEEDFLLGVLQSRPTENAIIAFTCE